MNFLNLSTAIIDEIWWMIVSVDYDYSRITISDHELNSEYLTLWLEDPHDFKNTLDECLKLEISITQFAKIIKAENLNSYEGTKMHRVTKTEHKYRVTINTPIKWYQEDASLIEQQWAREAVLKAVLTQLLEKEISA